MDNFLVMQMECFCFPNQKLFEFKRKIKYLEYQLILEKAKQGFETVRTNRWNGRKTTLTKF